MDGPRTDDQRRAFRLLLLEPDEEAANALIRVLEGNDMRFDVVHHTEPESALQDICSGDVPCRAAIVSNGLACATGLEFYDRLRSKAANFPVVLLFGLGEEDEATAALEAGVDDVLLRDEAGGYLKLLPGRLARLWRSSTTGDAGSPERTTVVVGPDPEGTEPKRMQNQLMQSQQGFRRLAESIRDVFYILDLDSMRTIYVSPAYEEVYGRSLESIYENALSWMDAVHPDDRAMVAADLEEMARTLPNGYRGGEFRVIKPDGTIRWLRHRAFLLREGTEGAFHVAGVVVDVTAQKEAEEDMRRTRHDLELRVEERTEELRNTIEAFEKAQRLASIGTLAAGIAHEINNPIGSILMAADTALYSLKDVEQRDEVAEALVSIKNEARRVGQIVRTVLQLSRQEASPRTACNPDDVARRARDLTRRLAMQHGVSVDLELDGDLPKVIINQTEIEQVFVNVINNAIEASRPGQKVSVRLKRDGEQFVTFVEDRGRGMTPEETGRIFDPFYTTRQAEGGTGLGLSLTYSIVRQHDGTIDIESQPGRGTRVAIRLPAEGTPAPTKGTRNDGGNQNPDRR